MLRPKKNSYHEFDDKKKILLLKNPPPPPLTFLMVRPLVLTRAIMALGFKHSSRHL